MKILVCIKQVPDTTDIKINPETNTLMREGVESTGHGVLVEVTRSVQPTQRRQDLSVEVRRHMYG